MLRPLLRRLALVPPTLLLVLVLLFALLNLAARHLEDTGEGGEPVLSQEGRQLFRQHFHLDLPVLLNTRGWLRQDEVRALLLSAHTVGTGSQRARQELADLGDAAVPHLVALLLEDGDPEVQRWAASSLQAVRPPGEASGGSRGASWTWSADASEQERRGVQQRWRRWYAAHEHVYAAATSRSPSTVLLQTRLACYLGSLCRLDLGLSSASGAPVWPTLRQRLARTLLVMLPAILLAYAIAVPLGVLGAVRQGGRLDRGVALATLLLFSLPTFFTGTVLLNLFTLGSPWGLLPTGGLASLDAAQGTSLERLWDLARHLALPVLTYSGACLALLGRHARSGMLEVLRSDYVRAARARGLPESAVIWRHALRNALLPLLTLLGSAIPVMVGGSVIIELIFDIPGMGLYLLQSIPIGDYNAVMGVLLVGSLATLLGILLSDLACTWADPRIHLG